jgi:hypothetical protein
MEAMSDLVPIPDRAHSRRSDPWDFLQHVADVELERRSWWRRLLAKIRHAGRRIIIHA